MERYLVVALLSLGCGSVNATTDGPTGDSSPPDTATDGSTCGGPGQTCCANNACSVGLGCTPGDQICRASDVWVAGTLGNSAVIAHGNGASFTVDPLGTGSPTAVWGTSASDVWVTVQGPTGSMGQTSWARHWNGTAWGAEVDFPPGFIVYAVWGSAPDNYWAVNNAGGALHWNGSAWSAPQNISAGVVFVQIWGASATDISAFGQNTVAHWDGSGTWSAATRADFSVYSTLAISGRPSGEVYAGGLDNAQPQRPAVLRRSGTQFTIDPVGDGSDCAVASAVWVGPDDAWALTAAQIQAGNCDAHPTVVRQQNGTWTSQGKLPTAATASSMWGSSNKDLFVTGTTAAGPVLFHYDGTSWTSVFTPTATQATGLRTVWGTGQPH